MNKHTPALMIQGTCSNAGKSLLTAALCRIFLQDGLSPAPFKSQNMALNSFVTLDGHEIGRAQALQAVACGREAHVHMNPVLLKPHSDMGSQVVVLGKPVGHMKVQEYIQYKPTAWQAITRAYTALARTADVMVIEGAGSPAEINLKSHDIVNMAVAQYAQAPVLLCADIDRGGAFASLVGTMALLDAEEKARVAGFILNKFRGDIRLLDSAFAPIEAMTQTPFLGTVPWIPNLDLPEEDSVSFRLHGISQVTTANHIDTLDIACIDTPHVSNFTDIDALKVEADVRLRVVRKVEELGEPDMLLLLGTKNTLADIRYLEEKGFMKALQVIRKKIPYVLGICGGLQMLGQCVEDNLGLESGVPASQKALGFLPLVTHMRAEKNLTRCTGQYVEPATGVRLHVQGYEIHHGESSSQENAERANLFMGPVIFNTQGNPLGWMRQEEGRTILGTYLHGILDDDVFRRHVLNTVRRYKGLAPITSISPYTLGPGLDRLAQVVRQGLDMDKIYQLIAGC